MAGGQVHDSCEGGCRAIDRGRMRGIVRLSIMLIAVAVFAGAKPLQAKAWSSITLVQAWGPCPPDRKGGCARTWTVSSSTLTVTAVRDGDTTTGTLGEADASALRGLVESAEFQSRLQNGFRCPPPTTDIFDTLTMVYVDGTQSSQSVSGCSVESGRQNLPQRLIEIPTRY